MINENVFAGEQLTPFRKMKRNDAHLQKFSLALAEISYSPSKGSFKCKLVVAFVQFERVFHVRTEKKYCFVET